MSNEKGQFMIEALIGVGILGLLVIFILSAFSARYAFDRTNTLRTDALYLAEQGIEKVKANPQGISQGSFSVDDYGTIPLYPKYKREYSFTQTGTADMNLYRVTVDIKWRKSNSAREYKLLSLSTIVVAQ